MLIALALDVLAGYLIARRFSRWRHWLPLALLAGLVVSLIAGLVPALIGGTTPGTAVIRAIAAAPIHVVMCSLCTWGFARRA